MSKPAHRKRRLRTGLRILRRWLRDQYSLKPETIDELNVMDDGPRDGSSYSRVWWFSVPSEDYTDETLTGYLKLLRSAWGDVWWHIEGLY